MEHFFFHLNILILVDGNTLIKQNENKKPTRTRERNMAEIPFCNCRDFNARRFRFHLRNYFYWSHFYEGFETTNERKKKWMLKIEMYMEGKPTTMCFAYQ